MLSEPSVATSRAAAARTLLFVPGDRPDRFAKAAASGADLVVLDLEDAVSADAKAQARDAVVAWLSVSGRAAVRVNAFGTAHHSADVAALSAVEGLQAVVVPMADDGEVLTTVHAATSVPVVALVETALGLVRVQEVAAAEGVARLAFGHLDFAADIAADPDGQGMLLARSTLVVASRAAGLPGPVDGVTTGLDDADEVARDAARSRRLGFTGKLCIHPRQVAPVAAAFAPTVEEVAWARRVLAVANQGKGAVRLDGQLVDAPVVSRARGILDWAGEQL